MFVYIIPFIPVSVWSHNTWSHTCACMDLDFSCRPVAHRVHVSNQVMPCATRGVQSEACMLSTLSFFTLVLSIWNYSYDAHSYGLRECTCKEHSATSANC